MTAFAKPSRTVAPVCPDTPEATPTFTLERQVARARRLMGERRWAELNSEWEV